MFSLSVNGWAEAKAALPEMVEYAKRAQDPSERNNARYWIERIEQGLSETNDVGHWFKPFQVTPAAVR